MGLINDFKQAIAVSDSMQHRVELCQKLVLDVQRVSTQYKQIFNQEINDQRVADSAEAAGSTLFGKQELHLLKARQKARENPYNYFSLYTTLHNYCAKHVQRMWRARKKTQQTNRVYNSSNYFNNLRQSSQEPLRPYINDADGHSEEEKHEYSSINDGANLVDQENSIQKLEGYQSVICSSVGQEAHFTLPVGVGNTLDISAKSNI